MALARAHRFYATEALPGNSSWSFFAVYDGHGGDVMQHRLRQPSAAPPLSERACPPRATAGCGVRDRHDAPAPGQERRFQGQRRGQGAASGKLPSAEHSPWLLPPPPPLPSARAPPPLTLLFPSQLTPVNTHFSLDCPLNSRASAPLRRLSTRPSASSSTLQGARACVTARLRCAR